MGTLPSPSPYFPSRDLETCEWVLLVGASHTCLLWETPSKQPLQRLFSLLCVLESRQRVMGEWGLQSLWGLGAEAALRLEQWHVQRFPSWCRLLLADRK